jgi:PAS domain S-box-containing protein
MKTEQWNLWEHPRKTMRESLLFRYGVAVVFPLMAAGIVFLRPAFAGTPFFVFLGAVVLSAAYGGLAPAILSIALSTVHIRVYFMQAIGAPHFSANQEGLERMVGFVLVSLMLSSFVAAIRRERNQLQDSEERYRMLAETASDAMVVIDAMGEILFVNPAAETVFGSPAKGLVGKNLALLLPGDGYQVLVTEAKRHPDSRKKAVVLKLPGLHHSGAPLVVEVTLGSTFHRGRNIFTMIIRDLTGHER